VCVCDSNFMPDSKDTDKNPQLHLVSRLMLLDSCLCCLETVKLSVCLACQVQFLQVSFESQALSLHGEHKKTAFYFPHCIRGPHNYHYIIIIQESRALSSCVVPYVLIGWCHLVLKRYVVVAGCSGQWQVGRFNGCHYWLQ